MTAPIQLQSYFEQKLPATWFTGPPSIQADDDEILCVGELAEGSSVDEFRASTRDARMEIAQDVQMLFRRRVSWGVQRGAETTLFTTYNAPLATRLRLPERMVLDTLVDAGVARSRSDALGWCVKLVARHQAEWLDDLRGALVSVERVRAEGPTSL
jgi:hypothetical protein